jgi:hypothetical protein
MATLVFGSALAITYYLKWRVKPLEKTWENAIPNQNIPKGLSSLSSKNCGQCHTEHYKEWCVSTHAQAWTDLQFQAELKKPSSPYLCINCHIPLANQQEFLIHGLKGGDIYQPVKTKNPAFDANLQQEGINCASCHVRDGKIIGSQGLNTAPHPIKKDPQALSEQLCISCHNASAVVTPELVCTFQTGDEWKAGPFYGKKNCVSCHLETVERPLVAGYPSRQSHRHYFAGSGIPKHKNLPSIGQNGLEILKPQQIDLHKKDQISYNLALKNSKAGHRVPSGDPERFILVEYQLKNQKNKTIFSQKHRIGEIWEWHPKARKIADNNIDPGETRSLPFIVDRSKLTAGTYLLSYRISKHRMDAKTAAYNKLGPEYPLSLEMFRDSISFSLR